MVINTEKTGTSLQFFNDCANSAFWYIAKQLQIPTSNVIKIKHVKKEVVRQVFCTKQITLKIWDLLAPQAYDDMYLLVACLNGQNFEYSVHM